MDRIAAEELFWREEWRVSRVCSEGTKIAKEDHRQFKICERALCTEAEAPKALVVTQMYKALHLEDHNHFLLMTMLNVEPKVWKFLVLRRLDKMRKLCEHVEEK